MGKRRRKPLFSDFLRINEPWTRERAFWCLFQVTYTNWALDNIITFKSTLHNYLLMNVNTQKVFTYTYIFFSSVSTQNCEHRRVQKRLFNEHSTNIKYCSRKAIPWERQFVNWGCNVVARCVWNVKRCGGAEARESRGSRSPAGQLRTARVKLSDVARPADAARTRPAAHAPRRDRYTPPTPPPPPPPRPTPHAPHAPHARIVATRHTQDELV